MAKLTLAGITGIVYVELDRTKPGEAGVKPTTFQPPYPVIPSVPSNIKQIESAITEMMKQVKEIDFAGISRQVARAITSLDKFFNSRQVKDIMRDAGSAMAKLSDAAEKMDKLLAGGSLDEAVATARDAVKEARSVIERARAELERVNIGQTAARVDRLVEGTSGRVDSALAEVEITVGHAAAHGRIRGGAGRQAEGRPLGAHLQQAAERRIACGRKLPSFTPLSPSSR